MEIVGLLDNLLLNMELVQAVLPKYSDIVTNFSQSTNRRPVLFWALTVHSHVRPWEDLSAKLLINIKHYLHA